MPSKNTSETWIVRWREDGKTHYARYDKNPNKNKVIHFPGTTKARQWVSNHYHLIAAEEATLVSSRGPTKTARVGRHRD